MSEDNFDPEELERKYYVEMALQGGEVRYAEMHCRQAALDLLKEIDTYMASIVRGDRRRGDLRPKGMFRWTNSKGELLGTVYADFVIGANLVTRRHPHPWEDEP